MPKVAIIYPYFRTRSPTEILFPPLGAASLARQLRGFGIDTKVFDCTFINISQLKNKLNAYQPDIVGIYSMVTLSHNVFQIVEMVRSCFPKCLLVAGGPMPTLYPEIYCTRFDAVFRGESDLSFPLFCRDMFKEKITRQRVKLLPLETYPGLFIHDQNIHIENPIANYDESVIQSLPFPDRSDFDHKTYQNEWLKKDGSKTTSIITTIGCPFNCDFCSKPIFGNTFRRRNIDTIFEEIADILHLGYDSLWIADDNFTLDNHHLKEFCQRIANLKISWSCLSRTTGIDSSMACLMKESGCKRVYLGLESGCQATLDLMNKQTTVEEGINAVNLFRKACIKVTAFFIVGYPGETVKSIEETFRIATMLPLDDCSFNVPFPLPGSKLFQRVTELNPNLDWLEENEVTFVYRSAFDPVWLRHRIQQTLQIIKERK